MPETKWKRRKEARPAEIVSAALAVFAEKGFAAARTEDIAKRASISKGALYLYFPTKEDLFRAVVKDAVAPNIAALQAQLAATDLPLADVLRTVLPRFAEMVVHTRFGAVAKMVIGESGNFPELARVWYDNVISGAISAIGGLIAHAQVRGEIRPGDPRTHAFSIMGPMLMGVLWRETFTPVGGEAVDLPAVARQHVETVLGGLLIEGGQRLKRPPRIVIILMGIAAALLAWLLIAPHFRPARTLSGYIEGETLYLASPISGSLVQISVQRGQRVAGSGKSLFVIKPDQQVAQNAQAAAELATALAQAEDARKGQRPAELGVFISEQAAADAQARDAKSTLDRVTPLAAKGFVSRARLDDARATYDSAVAQARAAARRLDSARLGSRSDQIRAADARVAQARSALAETGARLEDLAPSAPSPGPRRRCLLSTRRMGFGQPACRRAHPGRSHLRALLRAGGRGCGLSHRKPYQVRMHRLCVGTFGHHRLCEPSPRVYAAGDLQPGIPRSPGVHGRGTARQSARADARIAGRCGADRCRWQLMSAT